MYVERQRPPEYLKTIFKRNNVGTITLYYVIKNQESMISEEQQIHRSVGDNQHPSGDGEMPQGEEHWPLLQRTGV